MDGNDSTCRLCGFPGSDARLERCGCTIHARCVPLNLLVMKPLGIKSSNVVAAAPNTQMCPCCQSAPVSSIYLFPMKLDDLDLASQLKRQQAATSRQELMMTNDNGKRERGTESDLLEVQSETPYLLLLGHNSASSSGMDSDYLRTGRWTEEETAYVDFLVENFDRGQLVMPQGVRLNDMLRDLLLCKASRLTKKMKNAKLSTRAFDLVPTAVTEQVKTLNRVMLSTLERKFIDSISPEATRLELRCIISKAWRSFLSNLCLQVGSELLNASDWITSLEVVEARASEAEKIIRNARRRRMGMALKTDLRSAHHGVFISGLPPNKRPHVGRPSQNDSFDKIPSTVDVAGSSAQSVATTSSSQGDQDSEYISQILDFGDTMNQGMMPGNGNNMEYLTMLFDTLVEKKSPASDDQSASEVGSRHNCGPFLDTFMSFVESNNLPFEHIDVWVPSFHNAENQQGASGSEMRLFHAGYVTRADIDPARFVQLNEYGEYSTKFSFRPGCGLPGRVYTTGEPSWERGISDVDPKIFERAGGARVYKVNTGFGIPLSTPAISRMVVVLYSGADIPEDANIMEMCQAELASYDPEPKWKLVVDMPSAQSQRGSNRHRSASVCSANSSITSKLVAANVDPQEEENRIATLLGDHIPLTELPGPVADMSAPFMKPDALIPHFMYLRLLLLRSREKRSAAENEAIGIIRKSYRGYAHDSNSKRTDKEVAFLLVRDWQFLQQGSSAVAPVKPQQPPPPPQPEPTYRSHQFGVPNNLNTYASSGGPTRMPSVLSFVDPAMMGRKNSLDGMGASSSGGMGPSRPHNVNIVDEHAD